MTRNDLDVAEPASIEVSAKEGRHLLGGEVGHEAKIDLRARERGKDGFRPGAGVAGDDPADRAGRLVEVLSLQRESTEPTDGSRNPVDAEHRTLVERQPLEERELRVRRLPALF